MRKFKFRFWCKESKKWAKDLGLDENGKIVDLGDCFVNDAGENGEHYIAQQYTGIKSKDGQEICEGDIVQSYDDWDNRTFYGNVVYNQELASFVFVNERNEYYITSYPLEIVGNIFELPCKPDHNAECLVCDNWLEDCEIKKDIQKPEKKGGKIGWDKERCDALMEWYQKTRPVGEFL